MSDKMKEHLRHILQNSLLDQNYEWRKFWRENYCICMQENEQKHTYNNGRIGFLLLDQSRDSNNRLQFQYSRKFSDSWKYDYGVIFFNKIDVLLKICFSLNGYNPIIAVCRYFPGSTKIIAVSSTNSIELPINCNTQHDCVMFSHNLAHLGKVSTIPLRTQIVLSQSYYAPDITLQNNSNFKTYAIINFVKLTDDRFNILCQQMPESPLAMNKLSTAINNDVVNIIHCPNSYNNLQIKQPTHKNGVLLQKKSLPKFYQGNFSPYRKIQNNSCILNSPPPPQHLLNNEHSYSTCAKLRASYFTQRNNGINFCETTVINIQNNNFPLQWFNYAVDPFHNMTYYSSSPWNTSDLEQYNNCCNFPQPAFASHFPLKFPTLPVVQTADISSDIFIPDSFNDSNDFDDIDQTFQDDVGLHENTLTPDIVDSVQAQDNQKNIDNKCESRQHQVDKPCKSKKDDKIEMVSDKDEVLPGMELNDFLKDNPDVEMLVANCTADANEFFSCMDDETKTASEIEDDEDRPSVAVSIFHDDTVISIDSSSQCMSVDANNNALDTLDFRLSCDETTPNDNCSEKNVEKDNPARAFSKRYVEHGLSESHDPGFCPVNIHLQRKSGRPCEAKCCNYIENKFGLGSRNIAKIAFSNQANPLEILEFNRDSLTTAKPSCLQRSSKSKKKKITIKKEKKEGTFMKDSKVKVSVLKERKEQVCKTISTPNSTPTKNEKFKEDKRFANLLAMTGAKRSKKSLKRKISSSSIERHKTSEKIAKMEVKNNLRENLKEFILDSSNRLCAVTSTPMSVSSNSGMSVTSATKKEYFHGFSLIHTKNARPHSIFLKSICKVDDPRSGVLEVPELKLCKWKCSKITPSPTIVAEAQWDADEIDETCREHIDVVVSEDDSTQLKVIIPSKYKNMQATKCKVPIEQPEETIPEELAPVVSCPEPAAMPTTIAPVTMNPTSNCNARVNFLYLEKRNINYSPTKSSYFANSTVDDGDSIPLGLSPAHYKAYENYQAKVAKQNDTLQTDIVAEASREIPTKLSKQVTINSTIEELPISPLHASNVYDESTRDAQKHITTEPTSSSNQNNNLKTTSVKNKNDTKLAKIHPKGGHRGGVLCNMSETLTCNHNSCKKLSPNLFSLMTTIKGTLEATKEKCDRNEKCLKYLLLKFGYDSVCSNTHIADEKIKALTALLGVTGHSCKLRLVIQGHKELISQLRNIKHFSNSIKRMWHTTLNKKCFIHLFVELNNMSIRASHLHRNILKIDGFQTLTFCPSLVEKISVGLTELKTKNNASLSEAEVLRLEYETLLLIYASKHIEQEKELSEKCSKIYDLLTPEQKLFINQFVRSMNSYGEVVLLQ